MNMQPCRRVGKGGRTDNRVHDQEEGRRAGMRGVWEKEEEEGDKREECYRAAGRGDEERYGGMKLKASRVIYQVGALCVKDSGEKKKERETKTR